jgi:hypothetical protein
MNVFQSLYTPGALVRVASGRHAQVESFNAHSNEVTLSFADGLPDEQVHITTLRAGNNDSEIAFKGKATTLFPKVFPRVDLDPDQARPIRTARWGDIVGKPWRPLS